MSCAVFVTPRVGQSGVEDQELRASIFRQLPVQVAGWLLITAPFSLGMALPVESISAPARPDSQSRVTQVTA